MNLKGVLKLVFSIGICQLAAVAGSVFTVSSVESWYSIIQKPAFTPPNWVFAPVWTVLFILMGISLYLVWRKGLDSRKVRLGIVFFSVQLGLNVLWSLLFFGLQNPFYGLVEIIFLWTAIVLTVYQFWKIDKRASYLLWPYLFWVSFAAFLNYSVWVLNV